MSSAALAVLLTLLLTAFFFLLFFNIIMKLQMVISARKNLEYKRIIGLKIDRIVSRQDKDSGEYLEEFVLEGRKKGKQYRAMIDEYLLEVLELPGTKNREQLISIARRLDFSSECLAQLRSWNPGISALGARRAGLYQLMEAIDDMIEVLNVLSIENQFEILMGLARIGRAEDMRRAFEKIQNNILVNERSVIEILSSFPEGEEKKRLFRIMIHGDTDYISALFLKAMDSEMTRELARDIKIVLNHRNKEVRIAAVRALTTLDKEAPAEDLIRALEDNDWEVRALAAKALGPIGTPEASQALFNALHDQQWWVRQNSANALMRHPDYESLFVLAAESGDKYTLDSIIAALDNGDNPILLRSISNVVA